MYIICLTFPKIIPQIAQTHSRDPLIPSVNPLECASLHVPWPTHRMHRPV